MDKISKEKRSGICPELRKKHETRTVSKISDSQDGIQIPSSLKGATRKPDIVLRKHKIVIFVCHMNRRKATVPKTNTESWIAKFRENQKRDALNEKKIRELGWKLIKVWECETGDKSALRKKLKGCFLSG